jgi:hypothetical protein
MSEEGYWGDRHVNVRSLSLPRRLGMTGLSGFCCALLACIAQGKEPARQGASETRLLNSVSDQSPVDQLIPWLLDEDRQLRGIAFGSVIFDTTGKRVLPVDPKNEVDRRVLKQISAVLDQVLTAMNDASSPIQKIPRINEVSSHFEDKLRELLNSIPGLSCDFPHTAADKIQRSGYPDLKIIDRSSQRVFYLDPKLYVVGSRESSFRTFYFEPKIATNKVRDDAVHLVVGFEHELRKDERWTFTRWDLVDLSQFKVKLKAEFQGSNHDLYRPEAIVATSAK